ncbi:hypothetical protein D3C86_783630 [compost metagenome]
MVAISTSGVDPASGSQQRTAHDDNAVIATSHAHIAVHSAAEDQQIVPAAQIDVAVYDAAVVDLVIAFTAQQVARDRTAVLEDVDGRDLVDLVRAQVDGPGDYAAEIVDQTVGTDTQTDVPVDGPYVVDAIVAGRGHDVAVDPARPRDRHPAGGHAVEYFDDALDLTIDLARVAQADGRSLDGMDRISAECGGVVDRPGGLVGDDAVESRDGRIAVIGEVGGFDMTRIGEVAVGAQPHRLVALGPQNPAQGVGHAGVGADLDSGVARVDRSVVRDHRAVEGLHADGHLLDPPVVVDRDVIAGPDCGGVESRPANNPIGAVLNAASQSDVDAGPPAVADFDDRLVIDARRAADADRVGNAGPALDQALIGQGGVGAHAGDVHAVVRAGRRDGDRPRVGEVADVGSACDRGGRGARDGPFVPERGRAVGQNHPVCDRVGADHRASGDGAVGRGLLGEGEETAAQGGRAKELSLYNHVFTIRRMPVPSLQLAA